LHAEPVPLPPAWIAGADDGVGERDLVGEVLVGRREKTAGKRAHHLPCFMVGRRERLAGTIATGSAAFEAEVGKLSGSETPEDPRDLPGEDVLALEKAVIIYRPDDQQPV